MTFRLRVLSGLVVLLVSNGGGCDFGQSEDLTYEEDIAEMEASLEATAEEKLTPVPSDGDSSPQASVSPQAGDGLVGKMVSLKKTVEQTLEQSSIDGLTTSQSRLEEWFDVTITSNTSEERVFRVRYRGLRYSHEVPGEFVTFDSRSPGKSIPAIVSPLVSLSKTGFSFHTDSAGVVTKVSGLPSGLMRTVPDAEMSLGFVQDRIGFQSLDLRPAAGGSRDGLWMQNRSVTQPLAMTINKRFTKKTQDAETLSLEILGTMSAKHNTQRIQLAGGSAQVSLKGGHALGHVVMDRLTGLPRSAKWDRYLDVRVECPGGEEFEQRKHEVVTITQNVEGERKSPPRSQLAPQPVSPPGIRPVTAAPQVGQPRTLGTNSPLELESRPAISR